MTPHGLELRLSWGDHVLAEHLLRGDGAPSFTVGSAPGCAFAMDDLAGPSFEIARAGPDGFELRFASWMQGELSDAGGRRALWELVDSGEAVPDGDGYAVAVARGARAEVELGAITLRAAVRSCPEPVSVPLAETIDFQTLNTFLVLFALAGLFVVNTLNRDVEGEEYSDGFSLSGPAVVARLLVQSAPPSGPAVRQPAERPAAEGAQTPEGPSRSPRPAAAPRAPAQTMLDAIFSGRSGALAAVIGEGAAGGGELQAAIRGFAGSGATASALDAGGFGGLGIRGLGTGGSPGDPYAIGAIGTKGRPADLRLGALRRSCGGCGGGSWTGSGTFGMPTGPIVADTSEVRGALNPELVRAVVRMHRDQVRYCYEAELARDPSLSGKVVVKFVIGSDGQVATSHVSESTTKSADLDRCVNGRVQTWIFPKPKGGVVVVRYPFVLRQSGS